MTITQTSLPVLGTQPGLEEVAFILSTLVEQLGCVATLFDSGGRAVARSHSTNLACLCSSDELGHAHSILSAGQVAVVDRCPDGQSRIFYTISAGGSDPYLLVLCRPGKAPSPHEPLIKMAAQCLGALLRSAHRQGDSLLSLRTTFFGMLSSLVCAVDGRAARTRGHSVRVARFAVAIGQVLQLSSRELEELELAALLHDVGSLAVPEAILQKKEPLSEQEWEEIRHEPLHSAELLEPLETVGELVTWIRHRHERPDGTGYPDGLSDDRIPFGSRILSVADAFDAMTSDRPHRKAMSDEEALIELHEGAGKQFDHRVVEAFFEAYSQGIVRGHLSQFDCGMECD